MKDYEILLGGAIPLDEMNENDVDQLITRPLCHALGYRQGTEANIRTQVPLRRPFSQLGRKKKGDIPITGKPDFVCEYIPYGRFVVDSKHPSLSINTDEIEQVYSYSSHPEIVASMFLITNGRVFRLYQTSDPYNCILEWEIEKLVEIFPILKNILGPDALKKRSLLPIDTGLPLCDGYGSVIEIIGGHVLHNETLSGDLPIPPGTSSGSREPVTGNEIKRLDEGLIVSEIIIVGNNSYFDEIANLSGVNCLLFKSTSKFISRDASAPTIFQNYSSGYIPAGIDFHIPGTANIIPLPFFVDLKYYVTADVYIDKDRLKGNFFSEFDMSFIRRGFPGSSDKKAIVNASGTIDIKIK